ncbi:hypothetical protein MBLNU459_g8303t2 [Dothideomycetes sp. NU459]
MASIASLPAVLSPPLSDREAIADAIYRCVLGFDTGDSALFSSAFIENASMTVNGRTSTGLPSIRTDWFDLIAKLDTTHYITNVRINITAPGKASLTASALAQHYRGQKGLEPDQTRLLGGGLYRAEVVRDEAAGLWKIESIDMKSVWAEGDWGVVTGN